MGTKKHNTMSAAKFLGVSKSMLAHYRCDPKKKGQGPRYSHNSRQVEYDEADLIEWRESRKITSRIEHVMRKASEKAPREPQSATPRDHRSRPRKRQLKPRIPPEPEGCSFSDQADGRANVLRKLASRIPARL